VTFLSTREEDEQTLFSFFLTRRRETFVCKKHQKATIFFLNSNSSLKRTHINHQSIIGTSKEEQEERREERFRALVEENDSRVNNDFVIMVSVTTFFFSLLHFLRVTRIFKGNSFSPRVPLFRSSFRSLRLSVFTRADDLCSLFFFLRGVFLLSRAMMRKNIYAGFFGSVFGCNRDVRGPGGG
jgi:hypothetical protein